MGGMFSHRSIVSAIELGTSKITVLVGESRADGRVDIIGMGEAPAAGIVKGEIANMEQTFEQLAVALEEADVSSGGELNNSRLFVLPVTGSGIDSYQGMGTVFIKNADKKITENDRFEAHQNARIHPLDADRTVLNSSESYFMIDDRRRLRNPINQTAYKLDAFVHIVHGLTNRLENFRSVVRESGYEDNVEIVFAPLASGAGILAEDERENGVLLVDFGAGATEYVAEFNTGVLASGMIQVGFEHVINDLSIGLELPMEVCRRLIENGTVSEAVRNRQEFIEIPAGTGKTKKIHLSSFETIVDSRLRELFEIIRTKLNADKVVLNNLNSGAVLTGGGALFDRSLEIFREVFDMSVRMGQPFDISGAATGLESPRYSTVWGALKIADYYLRLSDNASGGALRRLLDGVDGLVNRMSRAVGDFKSSFRV